MVLRSREDLLREHRAVVAEKEKHYRIQLLADIELSLIHNGSVELVAEDYKLISEELKATGIYVRRTQGYSGGTPTYILYLEGYT